MEHWDSSTPLLSLGSAHHPPRTPAGPLPKQHACNTRRARNNKPGGRWIWDMVLPAHPNQPAPAAWQLQVGALAARP